MLSKDTPASKNRKYANKILTCKLFDCRLIEIIPLTIDHNDHRKILDFDLTDCLCPKILITYDL